MNPTNRARLAAGHESVVERPTADGALSRIEMETAAANTHSSLSEREAELIGHPFSIARGVRLVVEEERLIVDFKLHFRDAFRAAEQMEPMRSIFRDDAQEGRTRHWSGTGYRSFVGFNRVIHKSLQGSRVRSQPVPQFGCSFVSRAGGHPTHREVRPRSRRAARRRP